MAISYDWWFQNPELCGPPPDVILDAGEFVRRGGVPERYQLAFQQRGFTRRSGPFGWKREERGLDQFAAVREGRKDEFRGFQGEPQVPDPQAVETFQESKLRWDHRLEGRHRVMREFHRRLLELRRGIPHVVGRKNLLVECRPKVQMLAWHRRHEWGQIYCLTNFGAEARVTDLPETQRTWTRILDSSESQWDGPGAPPIETVRGRQRVTAAPRSIAVFSAGLPVAMQEQAAQAAATTGDRADANPDRDL